MWDLEDPTNKKKTPLCRVIVDATEGNIDALEKIKDYFKIVNHIGDYIVINLNRNNLSKNKIKT